jgi:7-cyano-7-deazaguanine synthase
LDSTVALGHMIDNHADQDEKKDMAVSIDYGQRHRVELDAAARIAHYYNVEHRVVPIRDIIGTTMLTDPNAKLPETSYADLPDGISPTYVPFRNGLMLSVLASIAQGWVREDDKNRQAVISFGAHAEDAANWAYPDCTPEFIGTFGASVFIGTYQKVRLVAPLMLMQKKDIVRMGAEWAVPFEMTWSCYAGGDKHCGVCPTCRARKDAFIGADVHDPTEYAA